VSPIDPPTAPVSDVQPFSLHDGPGIRTTIFLKGCPLRCLWCQNPESQDRNPQLLYYRDLCTGCGRCLSACPAAAVAQSDGKVATDRTLCTSCGECVQVCLANAREITGRLIEAREAADKACADKVFFEDSGGGVTLSGGEALSQPAFAAEVLARCKENSVHTAIETCGFAGWETLKTVLADTDLVLYDFKHMDDETHRRLTGVGNRLILENAKRIVHELHKPLVGRVPLIPGCNDDEGNIEATARFIAEELGRNIRVHLLPYNPLGESKNGSLEQPGIMARSRQGDGTLEALRTLALRYLTDVVIGG